MYVSLMSQTKKKQNENRKYLQNKNRMIIHIVFGKYSKNITVIIITANENNTGTNLVVYGDRLSS